MNEHEFFGNHFVITGNEEDEYVVSSHFNQNFKIPEGTDMNLIRNLVSILDDAAVKVYDSGYDDGYNKGNLYDEYEEYEYEYDED